MVGVLAGRIASCVYGSCFCCWSSRSVFIICMMRFGSWQLQAHFDIDSSVPHECLHLFPSLGFRYRVILSSAEGKLRKCICCWILCLMRFKEKLDVSHEWTRRVCVAVGMVNTGEMFCGSFNRCVLWCWNVQSGSYWLCICPVLLLYLRKEWVNLVWIEDQSWGGGRSTCHGRLPIYSSKQDREAESDVRRGMLKGLWVCVSGLFISWSSCSMRT